jgi:ipoprotein LpqH
MRRPIFAAVTAFAAGALGACTSPPQTPLASTASVTVNGIVTKFEVVKCTQVQWYRTIHIGGDLAGATVVVDGRADRPTAESVRLQSVAGFTGMYSQGAGDAANTRFDGSTYLVTGTANGATTANPTEPASADFKVSAKC